MRLFKASMFSFDKDDAASAGFCEQRSQAALPMASCSSGMRTIGQQPPLLCPNFWGQDSCSRDSDDEKAADCNDIGQAWIQPHEKGTLHLFEAGQLLQRIRSPAC